LNKAEISDLKLNEDLDRHRNLHIPTVAFSTPISRNINRAGSVAPYYKIIK